MTGGKVLPSVPRRRFIRFYYRAKLSSNSDCAFRLSRIDGIKAWMVSSASLVNVVIPSALNSAS